MKQQKQRAIIVRTAFSYIYSTVYIVIDRDINIFYVCVRIKRSTQLIIVISNIRCRCRHHDGHHFRAAI
jgi:hypothetical protein